MIFKIDLLEYINNNQYLIIGGELAVKTENFREEIELIVKENLEEILVSGMELEYIMGDESFTDGLKIVDNFIVYANAVREDNEHIFFETYGVDD